jgi:hypothetical protein
MAAENTDKFRKLSRRWVGQIGAGGVSDDSVTTVPLSSATNLPTDTAVTVVIDRVDANGTATPSLEETIIGVVSSSNLVDCIRGVEGTDQAHSAGAVVEVLCKAKNWNDFIDGFLVNHEKDGTHGDMSGTSLSVTGNITASAIGNPVASKALGILKGTYQTAQAYNPVASGTSTLNLALGNEHVVTMPATTQTLAISNATTGQKFIVSINNVTSQGALTWFTTIRWAGGTAPTLTGTNAKRDTFGFIVTGSGTYDGFIVGQNL